MNYSLVALVLDNNPSLPLTADEFQLLKTSRTRLTAAFSLEEIYDLLVANYRELEMEALSAAVDEMTAWKSEYQDFFDVRTSLNRRTLNLLSAARLYLDQYKQWLRDVGADPTSAERKANEAYDAAFEYRFMEALRNHVQHVGMAVHGVTINSRWEPQPEAKRLEFTVTPYTMKSALEADPKFKRSVLEECPSTVPTLPAARAYVGGISSVHEEVRRLAEPLVVAARSAFEAAIARHGAAANQKYLGLAAVARDGTGTVEQVPVFLQWDDVRVKLIARNRPIANLAKRALSN
ncbi:MAG: hypothetical protein KIS83_07750 [Rubrivivax sp.]|nr:hypothetical protein [Rubrivivax sp.]